LHRGKSWPFVWRSGTSDYAEEIPQEAKVDDYNDIVIIVPATEQPLARLYCRIDGLILFTVTLSVTFSTQFHITFAFTLANPWSLF
jgi:hypothetical protein